MYTWIMEISTNMKNEKTRWNLQELFSSCPWSFVVFGESTQLTKKDDMRKCYNEESGYNIKDTFSVFIEKYY